MSIIIGTTHFKSFEPQRIEMGKILIHDIEQCHK